MAGAAGAGAGAGAGAAGAAAGVAATTCLANVIWNKGESVHVCHSWSEINLGTFPLCCCHTYGLTVSLLLFQFGIYPLTIMLKT